MDWLWGVLALVIMAGLAWVGFRIEPHWVSKDAQRFLCNGQLMSHLGEPVTRWRETRVLIERGGQVQVDQKRFPFRRSSAMWTISAEAPDPPRGRVVFVLRGHDAAGQSQLLALRLPAKSRAVPKLRELLAAR